MAQVDPRLLAKALGALGDMPEGRVSSPRGGYDMLEKARFNAEQDYIKQNLPPPTNQLPPVQYVQHYTKGMSPSEILESEPMWAKARELHEARTARQGFQVPFSKAFSDLGSQVLGRSLTAEEMAKAMTGAAQYGIGQ